MISSADKVLMMNSCKVSNIVMKHLYSEHDESANNTHKFQTKKETRNAQVTKEEGLKHFTFKIIKQLKIIYKILYDKYLNALNV